MKITMSIITLIAALGLTSCDDSSKGTSETMTQESPIFEYIAPGWMPQVLNTDMSEYWRDEGINYSGTNYYIIPESLDKTSCSERFNADSDYFQLWLGIYAVNCEDKDLYAINSGTLDAEAIIKLGIADQKAWLREFANIEDPHVVLDDTVQITQEEVSFGGTSGWKLTCRLQTQADTGEDNYTSGIEEFLIVTESCWKGVIESYQNISMDITLYVWFSERNRYVYVAYYNSVMYTQAGSEELVTTPSEIVLELDEMARKITVP